jgi:hypothetical protein
VVTALEINSNERALRSTPAPNAITMPRIRFESGRTTAMTAPMTRVDCASAPQKKASATAVSPPAVDAHPADRRARQRLRWAVRQRAERDR